jgi:helix-turn-helix protein
LFTGMPSGERIREIARRLGRSPSSISDEIRRNKIGGRYHSIRAHQASEARKHNSHKKYVPLTVPPRAYFLRAVPGRQDGRPMPPRPLTNRPKPLTRREKCGLELFRPTSWTRCMPFQPPARDEPKHAAPNQSTSPRPILRRPGRSRPAPGRFICIGLDPVDRI